MKSVALLGVGVVLSAIAGVVWSFVADPPLWTLRDGQLVMGEEAAGAAFGVAVAFCVVAFVAALLLGITWYVAGRRDWRGVVLALLATVPCSYVMWRVGVWLGPPNPATVSGVAEGGTVPDRLAIGSAIPLMGWPIGAMAGVLFAALLDLNPRDGDAWGRDHRANATETALVNDFRS